MNQLPIELTLYYPTALQVENYLGFMAMLSIAVSLFYLSLPVWRWSARKVIASPNSNAWPVLILSTNPVGFIPLFLVVFLRDDCYIGKVESLCISILSPLIGIFIFSALT